MGGAWLGMATACGWSSRMAASTCCTAAGRPPRSSSGHNVPVGESIAVVDVDGVVADVRHRLHHLNRRPKDWGRFFASAARDPALTEGVELAREYAQTHVLVWLTGRPEHLR